MSDEKRRVLELLAEGKVNVNEAEKLLRALEPENSAALDIPSGGGSVPKYLFMVAHDDKKGDGSKGVFRMKMPLSLLRAGIKMKAPIPEEARESALSKLKAKGIEIDPFELSEDQVDDFLRALSELEMVAGGGGGEFRMYVA